MTAACLCADDKMNCRFSRCETLATALGCTLVTDNKIALDYDGAVMYDAHR